MSSGARSFGTPSQVLAKSMECFVFSNLSSGFKTAWLGISPGAIQFTRHDSNVPIGRMDYYSIRN